MRLQIHLLLLFVTVLWFLDGNVRADDPVASTIVALRMKRGLAIIRENEVVLRRLERELAQAPNKLAEKLKAENEQLRVGDKNTPLSSTPEAFKALLAEMPSHPYSAITANYSGEVQVEGLGKLTFPTGKWQPEFRRIEGDSNRKRPDVFIFRKSADSMERLTILRYNPTIAPPLPHLLDFLGESVGTGVPRDSNREAITGTHVFLHAEPTDLKPVDGHLAYSFMFDPLDESPRWLCHCFLFTTEGWDFVIVHSSTSVTSPEIAQEVFAGSAFDKK